MTNPQMTMVEYAVYKGDELLVVGTAQECADYMGWMHYKTTQWYTTPEYARRVAKRKTVKNAIKVIRLEDDDK